MKTLSAWADVSGQVDLEAAWREVANGSPGGHGAIVPAEAPRSTVHGCIRPADVRPGDPVFARARLANARQDREVDVQVWRLSPLGVELVLPPALSGAGAGDVVDLTVQIGRDLACFRGLPLAAAHEERGRRLVSARWADADDLRGDRERRRIGARWRCAAEYRATGITPSAVGYGDYVHFRIVEISQTGMQLYTSLRNKYLVPGVTFEASCSFPTLRQIQIVFRVVQARVVEEGGKEQLCLGVTWSAAGARGRETVGQYLLQFGPGATQGQLRAEGFRVRATSRVFDFGSVRDEEDYREVLALRRLAYVRAGKASPRATEAQMGDELDTRSRIITARHRGRLIGSIRVAFPRGEGDRLKHEDYCALPRSLPPRAEIVEVSKACTDPEFRGSDLFYSMVKHAALVTIQARRRWILMSCTDELRGIYRKLGMVDVGVTYVHPTMGARHHVMLGDAASMIAGGMNPVVWNVAIGPELYAYAKLCGVLPRSAWTDLHVRMVRLLKPLVFLARRKARKTGGAGR